MNGATVIVGGTGFIGRTLARRLASSGAGVLCLSRSGSWPQEPPPDGIATAAVDIAGDEARGLLERAFRGARVVVNLAGLLGHPSISRASYEAVHGAGSARVAEAARATAASGPVRLVHVSTTGVLGPTGVEPVDEDAPPRPSNPYEVTKLEGERRALAARGEGLEVVVVRPGLVYGPGDRHVAALARAIARGTFRTIASGRAVWQPVHVDDVARAIDALSQAPGIDGRVFHVAGAERTTVLGFAERIAARLGTHVRAPSWPYPVAWGIGALLEIALRPLGFDPPLTRARVRTLTENRVYAIDRIRDAVGFRPEIGLDRGLADAIASYRAAGILA